jgi:hypothetical protein
MHSLLTMLMKRSMSLSKCNCLPFLLNVPKQIMHMWSLGEIACKLEKVNEELIQGECMWKFPSMHAWSGVPRMSMVKLYEEVLDKSF